MSNAMEIQTMRQAKRGDTIRFGSGAQGRFVGYERRLGDWVCWSTEPGVFEAMCAEFDRLARAA